MCAPLEPLPAVSRRAGAEVAHGVPLPARRQQVAPVENEAFEPPVSLGLVHPDANLLLSWVDHDLAFGASLRHRQETLSDQSVQRNDTIERR